MQIHYYVNASGNNNSSSQMGIINALSQPKTKKIGILATCPYVDQILSADTESNYGQLSKNDLNNESVEYIETTTLFPEHQIYHIKNPLLTLSAQLHKGVFGEYYKLIRYFYLSLDNLIESIQSEGFFDELFIIEDPVHLSNNLVQLTNNYNDEDDTPYETMEECIEIAHSIFKNVDHFYFSDSAETKNQESGSFLKAMQDLHQIGFHKMKASDIPELHLLLNDSFDNKVDITHRQMWESYHSYLINTFDYKFDITHIDIFHGSNVFSPSSLLKESR